MKIVRGGHYTHPRFIDVTFVAVKVFALPDRFKVKCEWYNRGKPIGLTTKHIISRQNEFVRVNCR